jgi:hypothetical protein
LFEAGALAKSMQDGRVIPLLLDLDFKEVSGPLAQFQAKKVDNVGIKELISSLNKAAPAPVPESQLDKLFTALWGDLEKQLGGIPKTAATQKHGRPQGEILEELVSSVRSVEMRVRDAMDDDPRSKRRRFRFHPAMMHEVMNRMGIGPSDPIQILFIASFLRDDVPWVYELALEVYRALRAGRRDEAQKTFQRFIEALELLQKGPFSEEFGVDRMALKMIRSAFFEMSEFKNFGFSDEHGTKSENLKRMLADAKE